MHDLGTMARLNNEAVKNAEVAREYKKRVEAGEAEPLKYTQEDLDDSIEDARREGYDTGHEDGNADGWSNGYEDGHEAGHDAATEDLAGPAPLLDRLVSGGIETLEPFAAHYDAAMKALVFEQGAVTVYLRNELQNN